MLHIKTQTIYVVWVFLAVHTYVFSLFVRYTTCSHILDNQLFFARIYLMFSTLNSELKLYIFLFIIISSSSY